MNTLGCADVVLTWRRQLKDSQHFVMLFNPCRPERSRSPRSGTLAQWSGAKGGCVQSADAQGTDPHLRKGRLAVYNLLRGPQHALRVMGWLDPVIAGCRSVD